MKVRKRLVIFMLIGAIGTSVIQYVFSVGYAALTDVSLLASRNDESLMMSYDRLTGDMMGAEQLGEPYRRLMLELHPDADSRRMFRYVPIEHRYSFGWPFRVVSYSVIGVRTEDFTIGRQRIGLGIADLQGGVLLRQVMEPLRQDIYFNPDPVLAYRPVPIGLLGHACLGAAIGTFAALVISVRRLRHGCCMICGYSQRGLKSRRCPECGAEGGA